MINIAHKDIVLHYKGPLTYDTIGELITSLRENMKLRGTRFGLFKKLLTLMIESLENIVRYYSDSMVSTYILEEYPPEILISMNSTLYTLETVNLIYHSDIPALKAKLTQLNNFDQEAIKELYKATITNGKFSEKGGAGLGIIEMAKIVEKKMEFSFTDIDQEHSYFYLKLAIKNQDANNK